MDFSCYILSQPWLTPFSHPKAEAATQVQQQIDSLCSRQQFRYKSPPPSSLLPLLSGAGLRATQRAGEGGRLGVHSRLVFQMRR